MQVALNAVSWVHQLAGLPPPFQRLSVLPLLASSVNCPSLKVRKKPIIPAMLLAMVQSMGPKPVLSEVHLLSIAHLAFSAFLYLDELSLYQPVVPGTPSVVIGTQSPVSYNYVPIVVMLLS